MGKKRSELGQEELLKLLVQKTKIIIAFGILVLIGSWISNIMLILANEEQLAVTMALNQYRAGSKALTSAVQSYAVDGSQEYYDNYMKELNTDKNREVAWGILEKYGLEDSEWAIFNEIATLSDGLVPLEESAIKSVQSGDMKSAQESVFGSQYESTIVKINTLTDDVIKDIQNRLSKHQDVLTVVQFASQIIFAIVVGLLLIQLMRTINFARTDLLIPILKTSEQMVFISEGNFSEKFDLQEDSTEVGRMVKAINQMKTNTHEIIEEISVILEQMGNGDYRVRLDKEYIGEYVKIKESFIKISEQMKETFQTLRSVTSQINVGSEQLSCAAQDLAGGCTSQAAQIGEIVNAMKEMAQSMEDNAGEAVSTVELASKAGDTLMMGNQKMGELKAAIEEISRCSEQIGTIIGAIEDIASQTNLLSLNAAIEAARAGDAGKGFAVVAEQVKKLAEESSVAARRTTSLIQTTIEAVDKGIRIAEETEQDMGLVMENAKQATDKMNNIAGLLSDEVAHVQEVNSTIAAISEVVNDNSASSEETAAVSEEQMAQVETMVQLMSQFQI